MTDILALDDHATIEAPTVAAASCYYNRLRHAGVLTRRTGCLLVLVVMGLLAGQALAQEQDCVGPRGVLWDTPRFFTEATLAKVQACLAAGADPEVRNGTGWTPLHSAAAYSSDPAIIRALVEAGARTEAREITGRTALHLAAQRGKDPAIIRALVDAGAELQAQNEEGYTPLHLAAQSNSDPSIITALLEAGARMSAPAGLTPLHLAASNNTTWSGSCSKPGRE